MQNTAADSAAEAPTLPDPGKPKGWKIVALCEGCGTEMGDYPSWGVEWQTTFDDSHKGTEMVLLDLTCRTGYECYCQRCKRRMKR